MSAGRSKDYRALTVEQKLRVDAVCDRFEADQHAGRRPRIEDYLPEVSEDIRPALLLELITLDIEWSRRRDVTLNPAGYLARFPQLNASDLDDLVGSPAAVSKPPKPETPPYIGRYRVIEFLDEGGFGKVYLAHDDELRRQVAIKVPHSHLIVQPDDVERFLTEARIVASLRLDEHPNIVPVYDAGRSADGSCYVVSRYITGSDLATQIKKSCPTSAESAEIVATVADALHYAHVRRLVHRDVKPANILLDANGTPFVADFGLALKEQDFGKPGGAGGTPAYMSPEQASGEGHLVDGRSDIFSLGVVLYELLTGRRPVADGPIPKMLEQIRNIDARPPRQINDSIPKELERICLKALARRNSDRYTTAHDFAADLRHFLKTATESEKSAVRPPPPPPAPTTPNRSPPVTPPPDPEPIKVVPKGLGSFDNNDKDFFLELLPGARARDGLPESVRFWKIRTEETDADIAFRVGLIYGPSGCGKSSLVKAGLLPSLSGHVTVVYVEATGNDTESRLLSGLRKKCPNAPRERGLTETIAAIRRDRRDL